MGDGGVHLCVNGRPVTAEVDPATRLLHWLRNELALNGPKYGCGLGECGACAVLVDGCVARSCVLPVARMQGRSVTTLEGLGSRGALHWAQQAFIDAQAAQCGYCLNGMVMATVALLTHCDQPSEHDIREALSHHLCRCGTHLEILDAVRRAVTLRDAAAAP